VLALYRSAQDAFTTDDLGAVEAIGSGLGVAIEASAKPKRAATAAGAN